jgi:chemotaxis protein MotB
MARPDRDELWRRLEISEQKRAFLQKRLAVESSDEDATLWSFVDLLSLLLILFILFYSHAVTSRLSAAGTSTHQREEAAAQLDRNAEMPVASAPATGPQQNSEDEAAAVERENPDEGLEDLRRQILTTVSKADAEDLSVRWDRKRLVVTLGERVLFRAGMANLLSESEPTLRQIANFVVRQFGYRVLVAGHTDNTPIKTPQFPSNWELSTARAVNVAKYLIASGVTPERVSVQGYASYRPLRANTSSQNRQANRRVEITLFKDHEPKSAPPPH